MGEAFITRRGGGGGGAGLNFSVKAYASASALPSAERENTIAVITNVQITSWMFSATQPATMSEGMVWFPTGTTSPVVFNALKKNNITVCPTSAKQYISGAWVAKTAKIYQNNKWAEFFSGTIFKNGTIYTGHTDYKFPSNATIMGTGDGIEVSTVGGKTSEVCKVFGPIALDNIKTLQMTSAFTDSISGSHRRVLYVATTASVSYRNASAIQTTDATSSWKNSTTITLDVSSFKGEYYVYAGTNTNNSAWDSPRKLKITDVTGVMT
jgi:hypothetical protein